MPLAAAILSLLLAAKDPVAPPPVPWELTGTSSIAAVPEPSPTHRVERRAFVKSDRLSLRTGFAYLSRSDFYENPGVSLAGTWYVDEMLGVDVVSATFFLSTLSDSAAALRRTTGLLPDSQKPIARLTTGGRLAFAYGKLLIEPLDMVVHMDASAMVHVGLLFTDTAPNVGGDLGLELQAAIVNRGLVFVQGSWLASYERRSTTRFASGLLVGVGVGLIL